ncbi:MAG: DUF92 domain-containing protein, partial [Archaeoglobaceae archaeon]
MFPALMAFISLLGIYLDPRLIFALMFILTLFYAIRFSGEHFKVLIAATFLSALACFMQKEIIYAAIFLTFFYDFRKDVPWDIAIYTSAAILYFSLFSVINNVFINPEYIIFLSLAGALSAALVESVETAADKRMTMLICVATTFAIFRIYIPNASLLSLAFAFAISSILSLFALKLKIADKSGLISATIVGTLIILFTDIRFFTVLLVFYILGSAITKYKYSIKLDLGIAEPSGGARGFSNVFGNSLAPLFFAIQFGATANPLFISAFVSSVATALGDTMASEVGKTAKNVYLITNFKKVEPGTSGGISLIGEISALAGCLIIFSSSLALSLVDFNQLIPVVVSG